MASLKLQKVALSLRPLCLLVRFNSNTMAERFYHVKEDPTEPIYMNVGVRASIELKLLATHATD